MNNLGNILKKYQNTSIAVIGDICLDIYYFVTDDTSEISVETGLNTRSVSEFKYEAGGAGNVAINLKTLGAARVDMYGVVGQDPFGSTIQDIFKQANIDCRFIQTQNTNWDTHVFHKIYKSGQEEPRFDIGNFNNASDDTIRTLLHNLESNLAAYDAVIINQQVLRGYHNQLFQTGLTKIIESHEHHCIWLTDCRHLNHIYDKSIRKLNIHEASVLYKSVHTEISTIPEEKELAKWLFSYWGKPVVITLGEEGAVAANSDGEIVSIEGINLIGQKDTVGAGDAFISGLALTLAAGESMKDAIDTANIVATVSVTKLFETGHPTAKEVLEVGKSPDYRYNPTLAADLRKASYLPDTPIELIGSIKSGRPKVIIFDHDGTISTLRQGWEPIMKDMMIQAILGDSLETISSEELDKVSTAVVKMIEKTTGVQTIIQMIHVRDMVRTFGYVPVDKILPPVEYKKIYNAKLMETVSSRVELFKKGFLHLPDVTLKGAVEFLKALRNSGITLYLASGTDQDDVREEAAVLGYADLFDGGIFGSVGDVEHDPKRMVIETIIKGLPDDITPEECYIFGDGPVEMREGAKRNFTRIGVLSNEKQRFGTNLNKRPRLILGGAQALIPDFSWITCLTEFLDWEL